MENWIDATHTMQNGMVYWPGQDEPKFSKMADMDDGEDANVTKISISAHTATHMDAPLHFLKQSPDMTEMPIEAMTGKAFVFEIMHGNHIRKQDVQEAEKRVNSLQKGDKVLFKTPFSNKNWLMQPFDKNYPAVAQDAAQYLAEKQVLLVGNDYLSIAPFENAKEVHHILLKARIWIIEGLKLDEVKEGEYEIIAAPLKIKGADGAPVRVLLKKI